MCIYDIKVFILHIFTVLFLVMAILVTVPCLEDLGKVVTGLGLYATGHEKPPDMGALWLLPVDIHGVKFNTITHKQPV